MNLIDARLQAGLTQKEVAQIFNLSVKTIQRYEANPKYFDHLAYQHILTNLIAMSEVNEEKGILRMNSIVDFSNPVFSKYNIDAAFLFGSYAKGTMTPGSDIDIIIIGEVSGMQLFGLIEELRTALKKKIDLVTLDSILSNKDLITEVLRDGVKIYG